MEYWKKKKKVAQLESLCTIGIYFQKDNYSKCTCSGAFFLHKALKRNYDCREFGKASKH